MNQSLLNEARFQRLTVLIVDDSPPMREVLRALLQAIGITNIVEARDGKHAITKLRDFSIDIVVTDWVMEEMDGLELTRWLRTSSDSPNEFMPIIMVSGHTEAERIETARDAGINEFVAKPLSALNLFQRLVAVIEHPRPFVRTDTYFGPDRRRKFEPYSGEERRESVKRDRDAGKRVAQ